MMCDRLAFRNPSEAKEYFALYLCTDGRTIGRELPRGEPVVPIIASWHEQQMTEAKFVLKIRLLMESLKSSTDSRMVQMQYIQAVYSVIAGIYPVSLEEAVMLGALQVQAKFGDHNPEVHTKRFLVQQLKGFVPGSLMPRRAPSTWEADILERHAALSDSARRRPKETYNEIMWGKDVYGCEFFVADQTFNREWPERLYIGISVRGIFLLHKPSKVVIDKFPLKQIYRWGYLQDESFHFELKADAPGHGPSTYPGSGTVGSLFEFATLEGNLISDLLTAYAMQLVREIREKRGLEPSSGTLSSGAAAGGGGVDRAKAPQSEDACAVAIQRIWRGTWTRMKLQEDYAATRMQSLWRGYVARCEFDRMLAELEDEFNAEA